MHAYAVLCALLVLTHAINDAITFSKMDDNTALRDLIMDALRFINAKDASVTARCLTMYDKCLNTNLDSRDLFPLILDPNIQNWKKEDKDKKWKHHHELFPPGKRMTEKGAADAGNDERKQFLNREVAKGKQPFCSLESPLITNPNVETSNKEESDKRKRNPHEQGKFGKKLIPEVDENENWRKKSRKFLNKATKDGKPGCTQESSADVKFVVRPFPKLASHQDLSITEDTRMHPASDTRAFGSIKALYFPTSRSDDFTIAMTTDHVPTWKSHSTPTTIFSEGFPLMSEASVYSEHDDPTHRQKAHDRSPDVIDLERYQSANVSKVHQIDAYDDEIGLHLPFSQEQKTKEDRTEHVKILDSDSIISEKRMEWYKKQYSFYGMCPEYFSKGYSYHTEETRDSDDIYHTLMGVFFN